MLALPLQCSSIFLVIMHAAIIFICIIIMQVGYVECELPGNLKVRGYLEPSYLIDPRWEKQWSLVSDIP